MLASPVVDFVISFVRGWIKNCKPKPAYPLYTFVHLLLLLLLLLFCFILLTHEGSRREVYRWYQGLFRPRAQCTPSLHCPIANPASKQSQLPVRTRLIKSSRLWVQHSHNTLTFSHPSTNRAQHCLTPVIIRELVFPSWQATPPPTSSSF